VTERTAIIFERLGEAGTATIPQMIEWMGCSKKDAALTLGIMLRVGQIRRFGKTDCKTKLSLWSLT